MTKRPTPKEVDKACYNALAELGVRVKYDLGNWPIDEYFSGWIGLNKGVHPTFVRVNPHVGIHCVAVMKLVAEAKGDKYRKGEYSTSGCYLGALCPDVMQFIFESEADLIPEATRLAETIGQYGMPYIHSLASYDALLPRLREEVDGIGGGAEKYAAALYLSGDIQGAFNFIDEQIKKFLAKNRAPWIDALEKVKMHLEAKK